MSALGSIGKTLLLLASGHALGAQAQGKIIYEIVSCGETLAIPGGDGVKVDFPLRGISNCFTETGAILDLCSGKTIHQLDQKFFKVVPDAVRQEIIKKGETKNFKAGFLSVGFSDAKCGPNEDQAVYLKHAISITMPVTIKARHLTFTGDGRFVNMKDGSTILQLQEGKDYEIRSTKPSPARKMELR